MIACALGALFASQGARSVVTRKELDPETYMAKFSSDDYWPVLDADTLAKIVGEDALITAKFVPSRPQRTSTSKAAML